MISREKFVAKLRRELPRLVDSGVIDEAAAERLRSHYTAALAGGSMIRARIAVFLGILSGLLGGGGLVMIVAHNWDKFSPGPRLLFAFLPMLAFAAVGFWVLLRDKGTAFRESIAILSAAGFASALAIVSQMYHSTGSTGEFLAVVMIPAAALIYFFRSNALLLIYALALPATAYDWDEASRTYLVTLLAVLPLPFILKRLYRAPGAASSQLLRVVLLVLLITLTQSAARDCGLAMGSFVWCVLSLGFYLAGLLNRTLARFNVFLYAGGAGLLIFLVGASFSGYWDTASGRSFDKVDTLEEYLTVGIALGFYLWYWIFALIRRRSMPYLVLLLAPALPLLAPIFAVLEVTPAWGANLYMAACGILFFIYGWRERTLGLLNLGMAVLSLLIFLRFCNARNDFLSYGLLFAGAGLVIGLGNFAACMIFRKKGSAECGGGEA